MVTAQEKLPIEIESEKKDYLALPARDLLDAYGAGNHIPGSGSAAALAALVGIEMMRTVCKLTIAKPQFEDKKGRFEFILKELEEEYRPLLFDLFRKDVEIFNRVSLLRMQRDRAETKAQQRNWEKQQLDELKIATEIPISVCQAALKLLPSAYLLFDEGYKAVRGDSGVAISNLLSSISGALFIIFLNLKSFKESRWVKKTRETAEELAQQFEAAQRLAFEKVLLLYEEGLQEDQRQLSFDFLTRDEA